MIVKSLRQSRHLTARTKTLNFLTSKLGWLPKKAFFERLAA
jgi:hypothetical protein